MESNRPKPYKPPSLSLLGVVCDRDKSGRVLGVFEGQDIYFNLIVLGWGTAHAGILGYLGLSQGEKACFFALLPTAGAKAVMRVLDAELDFGRPGHGVAYTAPIESACYHKLVPLPNDEEEANMAEKEKHVLILSIVKRGFTEELMQVARAAGATGGTMMHARGTGLSGADTFFGITIQPEKEMVMILASAEDSRNIMQSIADKVGPGTDVDAISFSFALCDVMGVGHDVPKDLL